MSQATKKKHIRREILNESFKLPEPNEYIVKVLSSRGNNLHEVQMPDSSTFLVSMPNKFRKNVWIKKGDFILVQPIDEGEKVKAEMVKVLLPDYVKFLKKEKVWPIEFSKNEKKSDSEMEDDFIGNKSKKSISEESDSSSSDG
ncbi:eukaryotic translation initiation factor 1A, putative [Pediculus humanus corporis]|uniref:Probable RNA-binding protein EIF1AD n=1 Tax=Pediculus humanus subsp. corporis TaxID=121224 RepID=E0VHX4_PEDHC|nr:eukaryotic translation initiation factor 1A, putative [Pediculus humanus corporis]EEB12980.1 eukaryotic translation initiation factor 1A, putative [Pediculus humanus corporis]